MMPNRPLSHSDFRSKIDRDISRIETMTKIGFVVIPLLGFSAFAAFVFVLVHFLAKVW